VCTTDSVVQQYLGATHAACKRPNLPLIGPSLLWVASELASPSMELASYLRRAAPSRTKHTTLKSMLLVPHPAATTPGTGLHTFWTFCMSCAFAHPDGISNSRQQNDTRRVAEVAAPVLGRLAAEARLSLVEIGPLDAG